MATQASVSPNYAFVTLSTGRGVPLGPISWKGYKEIRKVIARSMSGPVLSVLTSLQEGVENIEPIEALTKISSCVDTLNATLTEEAWPGLIRACSKETLPDAFFEELPAVEFMELCRVATEVSGLESLIETEKNSLAAVVTAVTPKKPVAKTPEAENEDSTGTKI